MYEVFREDYECNLYVDSTEDLNTLLQNIAVLFNSTDINANTISVSYGDILILNNENFNLINKKNQEDGFLFYSHILKVKPNRVSGKENAVKFVSKILEEYWIKGCPAIATCNYESDLPNNGGYKSRNVPVPE